MTIAYSATTALYKKVRPTGTPLGTRLTGTIKVCMVGDSITYGTGDPSGDGYRLNLYNLLTASGLTISYVGNQTSTPGTAPSNIHRASVGKTLADHMSGGAFDTVAYISGLSSGSRPDVYIHLLGTNDAQDNTLTTNFGSNLITFVGQLNALKTSRHVWCLPPLSSTLEGNLPTIRSAIVTSVATLVGSGVLACVASTNTLTGVAAATNGAAHYLRSEANQWKHPSPNGSIFTSDAIFPAALNAMGMNAVWAGQAA